MAVYDIDVQHHYNGKNWLGSEVGVVKKTVTVPASYAAAVSENGRTIVKSGTIFLASAVEGSEFPYNGLLESDVDITGGAALGDLIIRGSYINGNLPVAVSGDTLSAFIAQGLYAIAEADPVRPY